jgi:hypothetical protein
MKDLYSTLEKLGVPGPKPVWVFGNVLEFKGKVKASFLWLNKCFIHVYVTPEKGSKHHRLLSLLHLIRSYEYLCKTITWYQNAYKKKNNTPLSFFPPVATLLGCITSIPRYDKCYKILLTLSSYSNVDFPFNRYQKRE